VSSPHAAPSPRPSWEARTLKGTRFWRARRAVFVVRRSAPRLARPASLVIRARPPRRPIFLIGCPRSGTTALRAALVAGGEVASVQTEGHILWNEFHPPRRRSSTSDALGAQDVTERERRFVHLAVRAFVHGRRFLDKTPENCLRVAYLDALFDEAHFVFLHRRGADNINSLIEGWRARPRFVTHRLRDPLTGIAPLDGRRWSFVLIPGWRELRNAPLEVICARQYAVCNLAVLAARERIAPDRWSEVSYERLVEDPTGQLQRLHEELGLRFDDAARAAAARLTATPAPTSLTPPRAGKWRTENRETVERVLPLVADVERRLRHG